MVKFIPGHFCRVKLSELFSNSRRVIGCLTASLLKNTNENPTVCRPQHTSTTQGWSADMRDDGVASREVDSTGSRFPGVKESVVSAASSSFQGRVLGGSLHQHVSLCVCTVHADYTFKYGCFLTRHHYGVREESIQLLCPALSLFLAHYFYLLEEIGLAI